MTDDKRGQLLDKIRALLAKAESTNYPEEAKAYQVKAQELMARYAVEELEIADAGDAHDEITTERLTVFGPYTMSKGYILNAVAKANRCKVLFPNRLNKGQKRVENPLPYGPAYITMEDTEKPKGSGTFHLIGFSSDVNLVKMLFTSLLVQATNEMLDSDLDRMQAGVHGKTWRNSFLKGYASGLTDRLYVANQNVVADYAPKMGLALIDKANQVEEFARPLCGGTKQVSSSYSPSAYGQGKRAANRANVGNPGIKSRKAIR